MVIPSSQQATRNQPVEVLRANPRTWIDLMKSNTEPPRGGSVIRFSYQKRTK